MAASPEASFARASFPSQQQLLFQQTQLQVFQLAQLKVKTLQKFLNESYEEIERLKTSNSELETGLLQVQELKNKFQIQESQVAEWKRKVSEKEDHISELRIEVSTLHQRLVWERGKKQELMRRSESADLLVKQEREQAQTDAEAQIKKIEQKSIEEKAELEVTIFKLKQQINQAQQSAIKKITQLESEQAKQVEELKRSVESRMAQKNEQLAQKQLDIKSLLIELDSEKSKFKEIQQRASIKEKAADNQIHNLEQLLNAKNEALGSLQRDIADLRAENAQIRSEREVECKKKEFAHQKRENELQKALEEEIRRSELKIVEKTHQIQLQNNELKSKLKMMRVQLQLSKAQSERLVQFERITLQQASEDKQQSQQIVENVVKSYEGQLAQRVEAYQKLQGEYQRVKLNSQIKEEEIKTLKMKLEQREQELMVPRNLENQFKSDDGFKTANELLQKDVERLEQIVKHKDLEVDKLTSLLTNTRYQLQRATVRSHPEFRQTGSSFGIKQQFDSSLHKMGREFHKDMKDLLEGSGEDFFRNSAEVSPDQAKNPDLETQNRDLKGAMTYMHQELQQLTSEIKIYKEKLEGYQREGVSGAEYKNLRLQLDEKHNELHQVQNVLIQERERVLRQESQINELTFKIQQLHDELGKVKAQRQRLAEVCSELKAELSVLRKRDDNDPEGEYYTERIQALQETIEELENKLRRYEMRKERQDDTELRIEGDHLAMVEKGVSTPQRLHYKANSSKATASQLLTAERLKAKTKAAQTKVTQPKKKPDSSAWLGHK